jgi:hypothetical protein
MQPEANLYLLHLYRLFGWNLYRLLKKLDRYHEETGQHPDILLRQAAGRPLTRILARFDALSANLVADTAPTYPTTDKRSPRYWLIYNFIASYIERHGVGPTYREIMTACHFSSCGEGIRCWVDRLEQDGLIVRHPRRARSLTLANPPPPASPLPPD